MKERNQSEWDVFEQYIRENQERFYRLAYSYVKEQQAALDIVQESIYKGLKGYPNLREKSYLGTWFYRIVVNESLDYLRKNRKYSSYADLEGEGELSEDISMGIDLQQAINRLEPKLKTVILLRYFEDLKFADIGQIIGSPVSTVKSRLKAALQILQKEMGRGENQ